MSLALERSSVFFCCPEDRMVVISTFDPLVGEVLSSHCYLEIACLVARSIYHDEGVNPEASICRRGTVWGFSVILLEMRADFLKIQICLRNILNVLRYLQTIEDNNKNNSTYQAKRHQISMETTANISTEEQ